MNGLKKDLGDNADPERGCAGGQSAFHERPRDAKLQKN